ncbi:MAG: glycosyltransferase family 4 protein [Candidatus Acidiferrales bacterium]
MRVGLDATCWGSRRGYGRFLRSLLQATLKIDRQNNYTFFSDIDSSEFPLPEDDVEIIRVPCGTPTARAASAAGRRALGDMWNMSRAISAEKLDLFFFPSVYSYVPLVSRFPKVVTVHDVIPERFPELVFPTFRSRLNWRAKLKLACAQAQVILTVSEYSRRCLAEDLGLESSRLRVVSEAADPVFRRLEDLDRSALFKKLGLNADARFVAYVGGFSPHKNLKLLVDVFRELLCQTGFANVHLLLIGDYETDVFHSCYRDLKEQVRRSRLENCVLFTGFLSDEELVRLLNCAEALVLPSFCEGFGLPAVEAAACGTPVIVTTESPLKDLLGGGAISFPPQDRAGLLAGLRMILSDPVAQKAMGEAALAAACQLSWERSARQLLDVFHEVRKEL